MNKEKTYNGNLNIGKKIVSVDTDLEFKTIVIEFVGELKVKKINNLNIIKGYNKLLIMNLEKKNLTELFEYVGMALFIKCTLTDFVKTKHNLYINKHSLELWDTLNKTQEPGTNVELVQTWESLTRYWEDIDFDGNNAKKPYTHRITSYDAETNKYTEIKEIRKK